MKKYKISLVDDDNKIIDIIESTSTSFLRENFIKFYHRFNDICNNSGDIYLFLSMLLIIRGNGVYVNNTHNLDSELIKTIEDYCQEHHKNSNEECLKIINSIKKFLPETFKLVTNTKSISHRIILKIIKLLYKSDITYLLDLIVRIDILIEEKNKVVIEEFSNIYKVIKKNCIGFLTENITESITKDFLLEQLNNIIINIGCFPVNDIKDMDIYSYIGFVIKANHSNKHVIFDEDLEVLYNNKINNDKLLSKCFNIDTCLLLLYVLSDQIISGTYTYYEFRKFMSVLPRQIYEALLRWIVFIEVTYNDDSKELYAPIFADNTIKVVSIGESLSYNDNELYKITLSKDISNASLQENYKIEYNGNMNNFLIEYIYFYNSYIKNYIVCSSKYDANRIRKVINVRFKNGGIDEIYLYPQEW